MISIFQNNQVKKSILYLIVTIFLIGVAGITSYNIAVEDMKKELLREEATIIGAINKIDKNISSDIIAVITRGEVSEENEALGKEILSNYGYRVDNINKFHGYNDIYIVGIFILFALILLIIKEYLTYRIFYGEIEELNNSLDKIILGDYSIRLNEEKEGQFYTLTRNINRLIEIVNKSISSLKREKNFLKDIISDISHQLKTPLSTLSIYNELIEGKMLGEKEEKEILLNSRNVLDKMEWLIINLLKIAKFEVRAVEFNREKVSLKEILINSVKSLHGKSIENENNINIYGEDISLNLDSEWVEEGFINIIKNAIEHSSKGKEINVFIEDNIVWTRVIVEDFGEGIDEKDINNIFKRFYKSKNSKKDSIGIGLALSKGIIEGNGGNISVQSKKEKGTKFIVTFMKI